MERTLLSLLFSITSLLIYAQQHDTFKIIGNIHNATDSLKVRLRDMDNYQWIDSTYVVDSHFEIKGLQKKYNYPSSYFLFIENTNEVIPLFLANGDIVDLEFDLLSLPNYKNTGSRNQYHYHSLSDKFDIPYGQIIQLNYKKELLLKEGIAPLSTEIKEIDDEISDIRNTAFLDLSKAMDTYAALYYLGSYLTTYNFSKTQAQELYDLLSADKKDTFYGKSLLYYSTSSDLETSFIDFMALDSTFSYKQFSSYFNDSRYVLLEFSSAYCYYSLEAKPQIQQLSDIYKDNLQIVSFLVDPIDEGFKSYVVQGINNWDFLYDPEGQFGETYLSYKISGTPTYFLFDPKGILIKQWVNDKDAFSIVKSILTKTSLF